MASYSKVELDRVGREGDCEEQHSGYSQSEATCTDGNLFIHCGRMFEANEEVAQSHEEDPLVLPGNNSKRSNRHEHQPVDENTPFLEQRVNDMASVELTHRQEVQGCDEQPGPPSKPDRMQQ